MGRKAATEKNNSEPSFLKFLLWGTRNLIWVGGVPPACSHISSFKASTSERFSVPGIPLPLAGEERGS